MPLCQHFVSWFIKYYSFQLDSYVKTVLQSICWGGAAYTWVMYYVGFFQSHITKNNKLLNYLSNSSFSLYVSHYFLVSFWNYIFLKTDLNHYLVWAMSIFFSFVSFYLIFEIVFKRIKVFRYIFGINK